MHHVTCRGNEKRPIFYDDEDRVTFLKFLGQAVHRFGWSVTAYVLMTNHFHLVVQTPKASLSRGMHWLNTKYVGWFNRRHERSGHLYQGRFKACLVDKENYFLEVLRYVVLNPVRAGMVARPEHYQWSSYRATVGLDAPCEGLDVKSALEAFAPIPEIAAKYYCDFVEQRIGSPDRLWDCLKHGIFLGGEEWVKKMRKIAESKPRSTDYPKLQRSVGRPKMHAVISAVAKAAREPESAIRHTHGGILRRIAAWVGWYEGWLTLKSIAAGLRLRSEGHISGLIKRADQEFGQDPIALSILDQTLAIVRA